MYGIPFDVSFLSAFYQLEKVIFALPVLAFMFTLGRVALWILLTPVFGRFADFVANAVAAVVVFAFFIQPGAFWNAVDFGYAAASKVLGASGGSGLAPLDSLLGNLEREFGDVLDAVTGVMR